MKKATTHSKSLTAEQQIMTDLINALIAERFLLIHEDTIKELSQAPLEVQQLYFTQAREDAPIWVYTDELCFLLQKGCRQGYQWLPQSPIYKREKNQWLATDSPLDLCQFVLRRTLSEEAYSHTGVRDFLAGLEVSIEQLNLSIAKMKEGLSFIPQTAYDWYVKGEMIASLRDRPFHPTSKAKIGFTRQDYQEYMAEFGQKTSLNWVAIANHSVVKGCPDDQVEALDVLNDLQKIQIERELKQKGIGRDQYTIIPVHPWQLKNIILPQFRKEIEDQTIILLDLQVGEFFPTSSVRSFTSPYPSTTMLKLPISVTSLGAARYLPVVKLLNGMAGEKMFRQAVACDPTLVDRVFLCEEKYWWGYMPESMGLFDDHPRHLAAQLRVYPQEIVQEGYKIIPMSSLGVRLPESHFLAEILGENLSKEDVLSFYKDLATTFYDITMRLCKVGILPEIHGQNCCVVVKENKVKGLLFRDHDSVRLHPPYLEKHDIKDPLYHIRPGYSNSLYNETIEKLIFYVQSLGTQVNLASIMEALAEAYSISEELLWQITETKLKEALQTIDIPEEDRSILHYELFEREEWPVKLIIRPLLEADGVPGAMPSGKGIGYNPFYFIRHL